MNRIIFVIGFFGWNVGVVAHAAEALVDGYHLRPATAAVTTGGTLKLKLGYCRVVDLNAPAKPNTGGDKSGKKKPVEDELFPLVPPEPGSAPARKRVEDDLAPLPVMKLVCEGDEGGNALAPLVFPARVTWQVVSGPGQVSGDLKGASYRAPAAKPSPNQATVAATVTYNVGQEKTILQSRIRILDEVKVYDGKFALNDVGVNEEYTRRLTGNIRWKFDEYYEEGRWREYTGTGRATVSISRKGCGGPATFKDVPVEGRLKVYEDKRYEFLINLTGNEERKHICRRPDLDKRLKWEETFSPAGDGIASGDPCGVKESYPRYTDETMLAHKQNGSCPGNNATNRYQSEWSFQAIE